MQVIFKVLKRLPECFVARLASEAIFVPPTFFGYDSLDDVRLFAADFAYLIDFLLWRNHFFATRGAGMAVISVVSMMLARFLLLVCLFELLGDSHRIFGSHMDLFAAVLVICCCSACACRLFFG